MKSCIRRIEISLQDKVHQPLSDMQSGLAEGHKNREEGNGNFAVFLRKHTGLYLMDGLDRLKKGIELFAQMNGRA